MLMVAMLSGLAIAAVAPLAEETYGGAFSCGGTCRPTVTQSCNEWTFQGATGVALSPEPEVLPPIGSWVGFTCTIPNKGVTCYTAAKCVLTPTICPEGSDPSGSTCVCRTGYSENPLKTGCFNSSTSNVAVAPLSSQPETCPASGVVKVGKPITPLVGAETHTVSTGFAVGGQEWRVTYDNRKVFSAASIGVTPKAFGNIPALGALWESSLHKNLVMGAGGFGAQLMRGNGTVVSFKYNPPTASYVPIGNNNDSLTAVSGGYRYLEASSQTLETYNTAGKITSEADARGNKITYAYSAFASASAPGPGYLMSATDNAGRGIKFSYTLPSGGNAASDGLVSSISNSMGQSIGVLYDANRNLTQLTWPDNSTQAFVYENAGLPWALTGAVDELGSRYSTYEYDAAGRAISTQLAGGVNRYSVSYGTPPSVAMTQTYDPATTVTTRAHGLVSPSNVVLSLPNGQSADIASTTVGGQNKAAGLSQPAGSGCAASSSSSVFNAAGNLLSQDDFNGVRSCYAYDASNREVTRVEGLPNTAACSAVLPAGATLPAGARKITTTWHPDWRLPVASGTPGTLTTLVYQGRPDPLNADAAANCTSAPALPNGKPLPVVCKRIVQLANPAAAGGSTDPYATSNSLLLHADGMNGSTSFADNGAAAKTLSVTGNASISTASKVFGSGSAAFASGGYLSVPAGTDFNFGSAPFTIEFFLKPASIGGIQSVISTRLGAVYSPFEIDLENSAVRILKSNAAVNNWEIVGVFPTTPITANVWQHVAIVGNGSTMSVYVNGVPSSSTAAYTPFAALTGPLYIGKGGEAVAFTGNMDEIRISKGVARYSAAFTPPAAEFAGVVAYLPASGPDATFTYDAAGRILSASDALNRVTSYAYYSDTNFSGTVQPPGSFDPDIASVGLLLHGEGANGSTTISDSSLLPKPVTVFGEANIGTAQSRFGASAMYFDGVRDYVSVPSSPSLSMGASDFTIEMWIYKLSNNPNTSRFWNPDGNLISDVHLGLDANGNLWSYGSSNGTSWNAWAFSTGIPIPIGVWKHVALVRSGGTVTLYADGVGTVMTSALGTTALYDDGNTHVIGGQGTGPDSGFNGYIDEVRITKGVARYTANFTPPTQAFPNIGLVIDPNGVGHNTGDLQSVTNAVGHVTQFTLYDRAGRVKQMIDPNGVVTDTVYTPRGWVSSVTMTPPGGAARTTTYTYDNAGQLTGATLPDGSTLGYSYDAAHRLVGITDAKGNTVTYTLDNTGNKTGEQVKDPSGNLQRNITRVYDALNRVQQVTGAGN